VGPRNWKERRKDKFQGEVVNVLTYTPSSHIPKKTQNIKSSKHWQSGVITMTKTWEQNPLSYTPVEIY
jgi:hypothetical protein